MIVKWIKYKDGYVYTTDITEAVSSVSWGGSTSQAARTAEIAVINAPNDKNVTDLKLKIAAGDTIKLYENNKLYSLARRTQKRQGRPGKNIYAAWKARN